MGLHIACLVMAARANDHARLWVPSRCSCVTIRLDTHVWTQIGYVCLMAVYSLCTKVYAHARDTFGVHAIHLAIHLARTRYIWRAREMQGTRAHTAGKPFRPRHRSVPAAFYRSPAAFYRSPPASYRSPPASQIRHARFPYVSLATFFYRFDVWGYLP